MTISPITFWLILALILAGLEMLSGTFYLLAVSVGMAFGALLPGSDFRCQPR